MPSMDLEVSDLNLFLFKQFQQALGRLFALAVGKVGYDKQMTDCGVRSPADF